MLAVLAGQVTGALEELHHCTREGLEYLSRGMELQPDSEISLHLLAALTELQKLDRVVQRLKNVESILLEWLHANEGKQVKCEKPAWAEVLINRHVMPDEDAVLINVLAGGEQ